MRFYIVFTNGLWVLVHFVNTRAGGSNCKLSLCCLCIKSLLLVRCQTCGTPSHQHSASHQSFHIYSSGWPPNIITSLSTQSNSAFALFRTRYPVHIPSLCLSLFEIRVHWKLQEDLISCKWDKKTKDKRTLTYCWTCTVNKHNQMHTTNSSDVGLWA